MDFKRVNELVMLKAQTLLPTWLPGGKFLNDYTFACGSLAGESGQSLKVDIRTGMWKDFATGDSGGDLISLYAAIKGLSQSDAAKTLSGEPVRDDSTIIKPPSGVRPPDMKDKRLGHPNEFYRYTDDKGELLFYIARYNHKNGKDLKPFCYTERGDWVRKMWPGIRPLYGLGPKLLDATHVLIVEGEKAFAAAEKIVNGSPYVVSTWSGGASAVSKTDWVTLKGKKVLIWPDADDAGRKAAAEICSRIIKIATEVKVIEITDVNGGWDAHDAMMDGMNWAKFKEWAQPRARLVSPDGLLPEPKPKLPSMPETNEVHNHLHITPDDMPVDVPSDVKKLWLMAGVVASKTGTPIMNLDNCVRLMDYTGYLKDKIWYDSFHVDVLTTLDSNKPRQWIEKDTLDLFNTLQRDYGFHRLTITTAEQLVRYLAFRNERNAVRDYFTSIKWDGVPRVETFCSQYLGAPDNQYIRAASKNWFVSIAARVFKPGAQVDTMVILEGNQGAKKSSVLRVLGGDWYTEATAGFGTKDLYQQIQGKIIVEIAELDMFSKSDVNTLKRVISSPQDEFRAPYDRRPAKFPRRCVFVGTTNQDKYLMDETGNRRYWPIPTGEIKLNEIKLHRDQIFAEAVQLFNDGHTWWEMPKELTEEVQSSRMMDDAWFEVISKYISDPLVRYAGVTPTEIATSEKCLNIDIGRVTSKEASRIGRILRQLGWRPGQVQKLHGRSARPFFPPDHGTLLPPVQNSDTRVVKNYAMDLD